MIKLYNSGAYLIDGTQLVEEGGSTANLPSKEEAAKNTIAYGILKAVRMKYVDERYLENGLKALEAVTKRIDVDGTVQGVSYGTGMGASLEDYRNIPLCPMPYGQALAGLLLNEALKLEEGGRV